MKEKDLNSIPSKGTKVVRNIIIVVIILIIILAGIFAYLYFLTDAFKTSKQLFMKYAAQMVEQENGFVEKNIETYYQKKEETPYENNGTFYATISGNSTETEDIINTVNDFSIDFSGKTDKANNKAEQNITLHYSDNVTLPMIYRHTGDFYGIQTNDVSEKYVTIENNNLKELAEKLGMDSSDIPDKIEFSQEMQTLEYTPEERETVKEKYLNVLNTELKEEQFQSQKNEDGTNQYTLTLQYSEFKNLIVALLKELQNDDITLGKLESFTKNGETIQVTDPIDKNDIENLISSLEKTEASEGQFTISAIQKNSKLQNIKVESDELNLSINKQEAEDSLDYNIEASILQNGEQQARIFFTANFSGISTMQNVNETYEFGIESLSNSDTNETMGYNYHFGNTINFVDSIEVEELTEDNSIILNDYDAEPLQNFITALGQRIVDINTDQMEQLGFQYGNPMIFMLPLPMLTGAMITNQAQDVVQNNSMDEMEITTFNNSFMVYEGSQRGTMVRALIQQINEQNITSETDSTDSMIEIEYEGMQNTDDQYVYGDAGLSYIMNNEQYEVNFEYNENGRINKAIISGEFQTEQ